MIGANRRIAERRSGIETDDDERYARRMNVADRRISPAIGEHAINECAKLREELKSALALSSQDHASMLAALGESMRLREELLQCRSKLALAAESSAGDDELIAELLAALQAVMTLLREEAGKDDPMEPFAYDKRWEDCAIAADAAIAKAQTESAAAQEQGKESSHDNPPVAPASAADHEPVAA